MKNFIWSYAQRVVKLFSAIIITFSFPQIIQWWESYGDRMHESQKATLYKHLFLVEISQAVLAFALSLALAIPLMNKIFRRIILSIFLILGLLQAAHYNLYRVPINSSSWYSIFDTNFGEVSGFLSAYFTLGMLSWIVTLVLAFILLYWLVNKLIYRYKIKVVVLFSCSILLLLFFANYKKVTALYWSQTAPVSVFSSYHDYRKEKMTLMNEVNKLVNHEVKIKDQGPQVHIIVIGESSSKHHFSLYGYERNTNPLLGKRKFELTYIDGAEVQDVHTSPSLRNILFEKIGDKSINLAALFNQGGFDTYWISNQPPLGNDQLAATAVANKCTGKYFTGYHGGAEPDEAIFPLLNTVLKKPGERKVIFVHLMGTHLDYFSRYPSTFMHFDESNFSPFGREAEAVVNQYDNAIRYNDFILDSLIKTLESINKKSSLVYFSDHGDEVFDYRNFHGHHQGLVSKYMKEVPLIFWGSDRKGQGKITLKSAYDLDFLIHTLSDWYGLSFAGEAPEKSVFRYPKDSQGVKSKLSGEKVKVWAHRCNSLKRIAELAGQFNGFEVDVYWNGKYWEVNHPPAPSVQLKLADFLQQTAHKGYSLWLDVKNPRQENIQELNTLVSKWLKDSLSFKEIILETTDYNMLPEIKKSGAKISFYLPSRMGSNEELMASYQNLSRLPELKLIDFVSQHLDYLGEMEQYFPDVKTLTWYESHEWQKGESFSKLTQLLEKHPQISVCLVNFPSPSWR